MFINCNYPSTQVLNVTLRACAGALCQSSCPLFSDFRVGPEGEGFLSGLVQREEGQPAEMSGDRPGAEEGGVCPAGEPAQEGFSELPLLENCPPPQRIFILDRGGVKSVMFNSLEMRRVCPSLAPILIAQKHEPIIKHGLLESQRGDTHIVQRETRHQWRSLTSRTRRLFAFSLFFLECFEREQLR